MVEEREGVDTSRSGSAPANDARSSLPQRKRLLAGLKQNGWTSPYSASSASTVRFRKKTRDLPNFSNCHACGSRVTNKGKDKLRILDSEWRIVLLCKNCFNGVDSAGLCSYCFMELCDEMGVVCRGCRCRVHVGCVSKHRGFGLWSNPSSDLFMCIDCWVPKSFANSNGVCRIGNPSGNSKSVSDACSMKNSVGYCSKSLEDVVNDAKFTAEKKIVAAAKARENALKKAVMARRAAELARIALDLVVAAAREDTKEKDFSWSSSASVVGDAEIALNQTMNSSLRISKKMCLMNSDYLVVPKTSHRNGDSLAWKSDSGSPSVCGKLEVCSENKLFENPDKSVSEPSICISMSDHNSAIDLDAVGADTKVYRRKTAQDAMMGNSDKRIGTRSY